MMDTVVETTGKVHAEKNARLLNAELAHRVKNTLAIVSAIVSQTFQFAASKEEAQATLTQRITALGQAHSTLNQANWRGASIRAVIEDALAPHESGHHQISVDGPSLTLSPKQSLTLALVINELATNAVKYGALSVEKGRVSVAWQIGAADADDTFRLVWAECNGPAVSKPERRGFGSRLIQQGLATDFGGDVRITYDPQGLRCELTTTMTNLRFEDQDEYTAART
jgi:two-component sensor histidine kinase